MADALDSKSSDRKVVGVQVPPPVLFLSSLTAPSVSRLLSILGRCPLNTRNLAI